MSKAQNSRKRADFFAAQATKLKEDASRLRDEAKKADTDATAAETDAGKAKEDADAAEQQARKDEDSARQYVKEMESSLEATRVAAQSLRSEEVKPEARQAVTVAAPTKTESPSSSLPTDFGPRRLSGEDVLGAQKPPPDAALIIIAVPDNAELYANGQLTKDKGTMRLLQTEHLETGRKYYYDFFVQGQPVRKVMAEAGKITRLDLTK